MHYEKYSKDAYPGMIISTKMVCQDGEGLDTTIRVGDQAWRWVYIQVNGVLVHITDFTSTGGSDLFDCPYLASPIYSPTHDT